MAITSYTFTKAVQVVQLESEIRNSVIVTALHSIVLNGVDDLTISFKDALSGGDDVILSGLVSSHVPAPIPNVPQAVQVTSLPDPAPFAQPLYRTKRDGDSSWTTCAENSITDKDFQLTQERYVAGGEVILKDVKEGDWLSAEVRDVNGVIPAQYRAALCEAHPVVAAYIIRMWLEPKDGYQTVKIDTSPLNAKISAGLYLRISYHASAIAGDRKMVTNYYLTKKL